MPTTPSPQPSPKVQFGNPFDKKENNPQAKDDSKPVMVPQSPVRRPSVLVAAGKETKLDQPSFLSSALRRLSSSTNTTMGKGAGSGATAVRKVMNIDQNRQRIKITELDQSKLKRVAFRVDVEIAGRAAQADEEEQPSGKLPVSNRQTQVVAPEKKDAKDARLKDMSEGAALKNSAAATIEKEGPSAAKVDNPVPPPPPPTKDARRESDESKEDNATSATPGETGPATTRKKEKKKRSEAERKERREKKRKHAEANGLVPLEITNHDDSDSTPSSTPGISTPRVGASPTTDPLRIYKRCCQLRETTVMSRIKEQISKPAATLAEAPGTVAVIDLSGLHLQLQDVQTFGDWLAVVPVRKLVLDGCNLSDEGLRIILAGLSSCKSPEQARINRKLLTKITGKPGREQLGIIEKLSLKNNPDITSIGWKHIALFLHISSSLKAIDLSGIPVPKSSSDLSRSTTASSGSENTPNGTPSKKSELSTLISRAVAERMGDKLEELILSNCNLATSHVNDIIDCSIKCKIRRLGLADNHLDQEGINHVVRYLISGICEGLDLGGNDLHNLLPVISDAVKDDNPLFAVSFANCNLDPQDLEIVMKTAIRLKSLKFIDLSSNRALFAGKNNAMPIFRKLLPKLPALKRIHLANVGMTPDHVIALAEVLPDCPALCHISVLDNEALQHAMNSKEGSSQEEACAFFASLMTAVRVSHTIVAIEVEVPSAESSEVVKALASQVVAYSLRNMELSALDEIGVKTSAMPTKDAPEVLLHLVGHMEGIDENHDNDEPAPDEDYMIASTGIVKALGVCLGTTGDGRNITPTASGTSTPRQIPQRPGTPKKPRNVTLELCESARKIRMRLRPALVKEDKAGNDEKFRKLHLTLFQCSTNINSGRLFFLDQTLQRIIKRFEDEYPETKIPEVPAVKDGSDAGAAQLADDSIISASLDSTTLEQVPSAEEYIAAEDHGEDPKRIRLSRTPSNTSLVARAYTDEEGRMHRFGQGVRREVLRQSEMGEIDDIDPQHLAEVKARFEEFKGEEIKEKVEQEGVDSVLKSLGMNARELTVLQQEDPEGFEVFKDSQITAQINSGRRTSEA